MAIQSSTQKLALVLVEVLKEVFKLMPSNQTTPVGTTIKEIEDAAKSTGKWKDITDQDMQVYKSRIDTAFKVASTESFPPYPDDPI